MTTPIQSTDSTVVFLRTVEYYSGILFLTVSAVRTHETVLANVQETNREGTLDEAFKSRIHISLHYPRPTPKDWLTIWKNNIQRVSNHYDIDRDGVLDWAKRNFGQLNWNGRQIKDAFQAATALAKFAAEKAQVDQSRDINAEFLKIRINVDNFDHVAKASIGFDEYLQSIFGLEKTEDRVLNTRIRNDRFHPDQAIKPSFNSSYQPRQIVSYQGSPHMQQQQQHHSHQPMRFGGYNQSPGHYGRRSGPQTQPNIPDASFMSNVENVEDTDDIWGENDSQAMTPANPPRYSQQRRY
jgi:hypothetical protein